MRRDIVVFLLSTLILSGCGERQSGTPETVVTSIQETTSTEPETTYIEAVTAKETEPLYMTCEEFFVDRELQDKVKELMGGVEFEYNPDSYVCSGGVITISFSSTDEVTLSINLETGSVRLRKVKETLPAYIETTAEETSEVETSPMESTTALSTDTVVLWWGQEKVVVPRTAIYDPDEFFSNANAIKCIEQVIGERWVQSRSRNSSWTQGDGYTSFSVTYNGYDVEVTVGRDNTLRIQKVIRAAETSPAPIEEGDDETSQAEELGPTRVLHYNRKDIIVAREELDSVDSFYSNEQLRACVEEVRGSAWNREDEVEVSWVALQDSFVGVVVFRDCRIKITTDPTTWDLMVTKTVETSEAIIELHSMGHSVEIDRSILFADNPGLLLRNEAFVGLMNDSYGYDVDWLECTDATAARLGDTYTCSYNYGGYFYNVVINIANGELAVERS